MISIRKLRVTDHPVVFDLFSGLIASEFPEYSENTKKKFLSGNRYWNRNNYKLRLQNKYRLLLGSFDGKKLVGLLDADMPFGGVSLGVWLMIRREYQRQGVGSKLVDRWEKETRKRGGHMLYLFSHDRNTGFYEKLGFSNSGQMNKGWFGQDETIFTRLLQEPCEDQYLR